MCCLLLRRLFFSQRDADNGEAEFLSATSTQLISLVLLAQYDDV